MATLDELLQRLDSNSQQLQDVTNASNPMLQDVTNQPSQGDDLDGLLSALDASRQAGPQPQQEPIAAGLPQQGIERPQEIQPEEAQQGETQQGETQGTQGMSLEDVQAEFSRRVQDLPELGQGGLLAGHDKFDIAKFAAIASVTPDPNEIAAILDQQFDNIGVTFEPDGTAFATNRDSGAKVVINKPGFSQMDVLQAAGLASIFTPAGGAAGLAARSGAKLGGRALAAGAASVLTQAGIEAAQTTQGGTIDPMEIAISGALGGVSEPVGDLVAAGGSRVAKMFGLGGQQVARTKDTFKGASPRVVKGGRQQENQIKQARNQIQQAKQGMMDEQLLSDEALERAARFERLGVTEPTAGSITQDFAQQRVEQSLGNISGDAGDVLRAAKQQESSQLLDAVHKSIDQLPDIEGGKTVKDVLLGREAATKQQARELYKNLANLAQGSDTIPIKQGAIVGAIPNDEATRKLLRGADPQAKQQLEELFQDFGLVELSEDALKARQAKVTGIDALAGATPDIRPLSLNNAEEFRAALNAVQKSDSKGSLKGLINNIKEALDDELDLAFTAGINSPNAQLSKASKEARDAWRAVKVEFTDKDIVGKLIARHKDGVTDIVKDQDVFKKLISFSSGTRTKDQLSKVISSLSKEGEKGKQAIGALQRDVIFEALERAQKATSSDTIEGVQLFNGRGFKKAIDGIGEEELSILFKNNPEGLKRLKDITQAGIDVRPSAEAKIKGSGGTIVDLLSGKSGLLGKLPPSLSGQLIPLMNEMAMKSKNLKIAKESVGASSKQKKLIHKAEKIRLSKKNQKIARDLMDNYPALSTAIGLNQVLSDKDLKQE